MKKPIDWRALFRKWRYPLLSTLVMLGLLTVSFNATVIKQVSTLSTATTSTSSNTIGTAVPAVPSIEVPDKRCKAVMPGLHFSLFDSKAFCDSFAMALLFNKRSEFLRLLKRYYSYNTGAYIDQFLDDNVPLKVTYDDVVLAERGPNVYFAQAYKDWISADRCTTFRFFNTQLFCFNEVHHPTKGKIVKKSGLHYMIPVMTALKYTHTTVENQLAGNHTGQNNVDSYGFTYSYKTIYTDATNHNVLGYPQKGTSSSTQYGINFRYGDPTNCNIYLDENFGGAANHKNMPANLWPTFFTPNADGKHQVIFVCGHTINNGSAIGHADIYKAHFIERLSDAAIMYHEANHVYGGHTGCDHNLHPNSAGKDRDFATVYGAHINMAFKLSLSPYLTCDERKYIFNIARRELHGTTELGKHDELKNKLCSGQELDARTSNGGLITPHHYLEDSPPECN